MKVAIIGSRGYRDLDHVRRFVAELPADTVVVSGGAAGVDKVAELAARKRGLQTEVYRADWKAHGRAAGPIRNKKIVEAADEVVAFWDGKSRGTMNSVAIAWRLGKRTKVIQTIVL